MAERGHTLLIVLSAVAIAGFVTAWAYPPVADAPLGVPVAGWTVCDLAVGESVERPFVLEHAFERISVSYDIVEARHLRMAFVDPTGRVVDAVAEQDQQGRDVLRLEAAAPPLGDWKWRLSAVQGAEGAGYMTQGDFVVLGFGLDGEVRRTAATGGTMPSGTCP